MDELVEGGADEAAFVARCWDDLLREGTERDAEDYPRLPFPSFEMSYAGVKRYYEKARETAEKG